MWIFLCFILTCPGKVVKEADGYTIYPMWLVLVEYAAQRVSMRVPKQQAPCMKTTDGEVK